MITDGCDVLLMLFIIHVLAGGCNSLCIAVARVKTVALLRYYPYTMPKMGKVDAKSKTTTPAQSEIEQVVDVSAKQMAKSQVLTSLLTMSWRLAIALLVPIAVGARLDSHFGTKPSYTLVGFVLAVALASYIIYIEFQELQANQNTPATRKNDKKNKNATKRSPKKKGVV